MNRRTFSKIAVATALPFMSYRKKLWSVQLLRHATLLIKANNTTILVDPMFSPKGGMDPVGNAGNDIRIPIVDLPVTTVELTKILSSVDAIFVTHTHRDHWDPEAQTLLNKSIPVFCQPSDVEKIRGQGFNIVQPVNDKLEVTKGLIVHRTGGQHGTGEIGQKMGAVSGFVFELEDEHLYIAGDTIWCTEVEDALKKFKPQTTIVNAGGAQFLTGGPITMNAEDVKKTTNAVGPGTVIAVHMDTINHCNVTRPVLKKFIAENNLTNVQIPDDGASITS